MEHIVEPGETLDTAERKIFCGGKGLNQSIALARAGLEVHHAGMIGEDGEMLVDLCRKENIHTHYIWKVPGPSGHTIIQVDESGQNCILLYGGGETGNLPKIISMKCWRISARRISYLCRTRSIS